MAQLTLLTIATDTQQPQAFSIKEGSHLKKISSSDQRLQAWFLLPNYTTLEPEPFFQRYRDYGIQCFSQLPHCFSGFLYDSQSHKWIIGVDKFASIPLYYAQLQERIYLSNQIESIANLINSEPLYPQSLLAYFYFHFIPSPLTHQEHIKKILPGNVLIIQGKQCIEIPYSPKVTSRLKSVLKANADTDCFKILENCVKPYASKNYCGAFLSGGLDSSTLTYLLTQSRPHFPVFSIFFQEKGFDESTYAKLMAATTQAQHHTCIYDAKTFIQDIAEVLPKLSQPFGNLSLFPSYQIAKMAKQQGIETLIAGDGGDEVFGGNHRYLLQHQYQSLQNSPYLMRKLLLLLARIRYPKRKYQRLLYKLNTPLPLRLYTDAFLYHWKLTDLFNSDFLATVDMAELEEICIFHYSDLMQLPFQKRLLQYDWRFTLSDNDLTKVRLACEIAGIDVVFPYLSPPLVDYAMSLPSSSLFTLRKLRPFFHQMVKPHLPEIILNKPKHGFSLPFGLWLQTDKNLQALIYDNVNQFKSENILKASFIDQLLQQAHQHPTYYSVFVWLISALQLWKKTHPITQLKQNAYEKM